MEKKMPIKKIADASKPCFHPDHEQPKHMILQPVTYEHICPNCEKKIIFVVPNITCQIHSTEEERLRKLAEGPAIELDSIAPSIDLTNFALLIEIQPVPTIAGILDATANELYRRRHWPSIAGRVKDAARDLRVVSR